jgi:deoxyribonuclease IV
MTNRKIGAHVSTAGGVDKAIKRAADIGANCVQIFSGSPRVWKRSPLDSIDTDKVFSEQEVHGVAPIFTHALYLVNLASDKPELLEKSINALKHDLKFDSLLKGAGIIVHLGSHQGRGWEADRDQVVAAMADILQDSPADSTFLIENSAGQKGKLCSDLSEIRWLMDELIEKLGADVVGNRVGWCFDTCHGHCAGYAIGSETLTQNPGVGHGLVAEAITELKLWPSLKLIHVNDARDPFASGRDRHANLGEGEIPAADFQKFLNLTEVKSIPLALEVPGAEKKGPDAENIARLRKMVE